MSPDSASIPIPNGLKSRKQSISKDSDCEVENPGVELSAEVTSHSASRTAMISELSPCTLVMVHIGDRAYTALLDSGSWSTLAGPKLTPALGELEPSKAFFAAANNAIFPAIGEKSLDLAFGTIRRRLTVFATNN